MLAQHHVDQGAVAINRAIQIPPAAVHPDIGFVDIPATAYAAFASAAQILCQCRRELCLPITDGLMAENKTADEEHLGQIPQAELVAQPPEHHESDHVTRVLRPVQRASAALVELLAATAAEPTIALRRALRSFPDGCRSIHRTPHRASSQTGRG